MLGRGTLRLRWSEWPDLSPNDRRTFLEGVGTTADVYVNGRLALRISKLGWLLRMDPIIEPWAVA